MKFGHLRKAMEIAPEAWDDMEIRVCWGQSPDRPTTEVVNHMPVMVRKDNDTVDHDAEDGDGRLCILIFAENPNFQHVKVGK